MKSPHQQHQQQHYYYLQTSGSAPGPHRSGVQESSSRGKDAGLGLTSTVLGRTSTVLGRTSTVLGLTSTLLVGPPLYWSDLHSTGRTSTLLVGPPLYWSDLHCTGRTSTVLGWTASREGTSGNIWEHLGLLWNNRPHSERELLLLLLRANHQREETVTSA
ncbi:unnamed protein product [Boreogadus saida]